MKTGVLFDSFVKKDKNYQSLTALYGAMPSPQDISGYDPTGVHTWSEIESDPVLYEKYLSRGENWDDPLSGILDAPGPTIQGEGQGKQRISSRRGSQRDRNLALLQFLQGGSPIKQLEKSGFMGSMESAYKDAPETLEKGLFSKIIPGGAFNPKAMKRLVTSWGSGYTNPRYANVAARGGIMSAWNNRR